MLKILSIISIVAAVFSSVSLKLSDIFGLDENKAGEIILESEVNNG